MAEYLALLDAGRFQPSVQMRHRLGRPERSAADAKPVVLGAMDVDLAAALRRADKIHAGDAHQFRAAAMGIMADGNYLTVAQAIRVSRQPEELVPEGAPWV